MVFLPGRTTLKEVLEAQSQLTDASSLMDDGVDKWDAPNLIEALSSTDEGNTDLERYVYVDERGIFFLDGEGHYNYMDPAWRFTR